MKFDSSSPVSFKIFRSRYRYNFFGIVRYPVPWLYISISRKLSRGKKSQGKAAFECRLLFCENPRKNTHLVSIWRMMMIELDRLRKGAHHLFLLHLLFLLLHVPAACTVPQTGLLLAGAQTGLLGQPFLDLPPVYAVLQSRLPLSSQHTVVLHVS